MCDVLEKPVKPLLSVPLPDVITHLSLNSNCIVKAGSRHTDMVHIDVIGHRSMEFDGIS